MVGNSGRAMGPATGTAMVTDIRPGLDGSNPRGLTEVAGTLYFIANDGTHGDQLWRSNGTVAGTFMVKEIAPGGVSCSRPRTLTNVGGILYFAAFANSRHGCELWKSDGTRGGTVLVKDIHKLGGSNPNEFTGMGGTLYFSAFDEAHGWALWRSDGTADGTYLVKDTQRGPAPCCVRGNHLYSLTNVDGVLYFSARGGALGQELWKSDGTEAGSVLVKDLSPGIRGSWPYSIVALEATPYFTAGERTHGRELWTSDGTGAGTVVVKDIWPGPRSSSPQPIVVLREGPVLRHHLSAGHGRELWMSDGTGDGTGMLKDIWSGPAELLPRSISSMWAKNLYFAADDGAHGQELWMSDRTHAGTTMVKDIWPGSEGSSSIQLVSVEGGLYFSAEDAQSWAGAVEMRRDRCRAPSWCEDICARSAPSGPKELVYICRLRRQDVCQPAAGSASIVLAASVLLGCR